MKRVSVTELKNQLSRYLRLVKRGETVEVMERSVPVARLQAVAPASIDHDAHMRRLVRDGLIIPARKGPYLDFLKRPPVPCSVDAVQILIEQRGDR
jgi:prevent-host-death family protein